MNFLNSAKLAVVGTVGLSAIAVLGVPQMAAAQPDCGPGEEWVRTCAPGTDEFPLSWAYLELLLEGESSPINLILSGPATVERGAPTQDAQGNWYIPTTLTETFTLGDLTLTGTGTGRIIENSQDTTLADSFFDVFADISFDFDGDGNLDIARNQDPITVYGNKWLVGVPPNDPAVAPVSPPPAFSSRPPSWDQNECDATDPKAAIIYCGFDNVEFFLVDAQGNITGERVATLLSEKHVVHTPEPATALTTLFVGLGAIFGLRKKGIFKKK